MFLFLSIALVLVFVWIYFFIWSPNKADGWRLSTKSFPEAWRAVLRNEVVFYTALNESQKRKFELRVQEFLLNCKLVAVKTTIDDVDRLLVAASAVIPVFGFKDWRYTDLNKVIIYPTTFNEKLETTVSGRRILGMVGNGPMGGKMILSKEALRIGFKNESDKKNTAIHEFVHLIDKRGGTIDGLPSVLMEKQYAIPWLDFINNKLEEIYSGESDFNSYGGTNKAEFFSVVSEYFFERPKLLKRKHPELYAHLAYFFKQDMSARNLNPKIINIGRNSQCPCDSGRKYKRCCGIN